MHMSMRLGVFREWKRSPNSWMPATSTATV